MLRSSCGVVLCSNVNLILEQLCVEGNRKQAKYAVSAIAAMTADSGLKALSVLYGVSCYWRSFEHNDISFVWFLLVIVGQASVDKWWCVGCNLAEAGG